MSDFLRRRVAYWLLAWMELGCALIRIATLGLAGDGLSFKAHGWYLNLNTPKQWRKKP